MSIKNWISKNTNCLNGGWVAVTGSTGGIGKELCKYIALLGGNIVLVDRNEEKSAALEKELMAQFKGLKIVRIKADMSDMSSVKEAVKKLESLPLFAVILNAGAYSIKRKRCSTGYDNLFQINFISPYYIARKLAPTLNKNGGRIIAVGSIAHNYSKADKKDIDSSFKKANSKAYGNAKRYLMYSLSALAESKNFPNLAITHPGITFTGITNHYPRLVFAIIKHPMKVIFMKPKKAALSILAGLFEDTGKNRWIGPSLFNIWGMPKSKSLKTADRIERDFISKTAEKIYNELI